MMIFFLVNIVFQYLWLNKLNKTPRQLALLLVGVTLVFVVVVLYVNIKGKKLPVVADALFWIMGTYIMSHILTFPISQGIQKIVQRWRYSHYKKLLKKSLTRVTPNLFNKLLKSLEGYVLTYEMEDEDYKLLRVIYKQVRNSKDISKTDQMTFAQLLIVNGVEGIDLPRTYDINIHSLSSADHILQVAYSALKETKLVMEIAPNAALCSCRKYGENLTRYLIKYHQIELNQEVGDDSFSSMLYALKQSKVIQDPHIIKNLYQIKEVGNDAAHEQLCDLKTARDVYDDALIVETWFRRHLQGSKI
jgi:hypothetical protein